MRCEEIKKILSFYLENETSPEENEMIQNHLRICQNCSALLSFLKETRESLTDFPELEVSDHLLEKLHDISRKRKRFSLGFDFFLNPSLQPVFVVATVCLMMISFYVFHPDKKSIDKSINRQIHLGYSKVEKLYAEAGSLTDNLGAYKDNLIDSLKNMKILRKNEDNQ